MPSFPFERIQALESAFGGRQVLEPAHRDGTVLVGPGAEGAESVSNKDQPSGYAGLDAATKLKLAELPSSVVTDTSVDATSPVSVTASPRNRALRDFFSAKDFGAIGNGSTDDTAALLSAVTAAQTSGRRLYLPAGKYKISNSINSNASNQGRLPIMITGESPDSSELQQAAGFPANTIIQPQGSQGAVTAITAPVAAGDQIIHVASTAGMVVGEPILIIDATQLIYANGPTRDATACNSEWQRIRSVDSGTQITLRGVVDFAYTTSGTVQPLNHPAQLRLEGFSIRNMAPGTQQYGANGITLTYGYNFTIQDLAFYDMDNNGIALLWTLDGRISNIEFYDFHDLEFATTTNGPYMINGDRATSHVQVDHIRSRYGRHQITLISDLTSGAPSYWKIADCIATEHTAAAFDTHPGARHITFQDCHVHNSQPGASYNPVGFEIRGPDIDLIDCTVNNVPGSGCNGVLVMYGADRCRIVGGRYSNCDTGITITDSDDCYIGGGVLIDTPATQGIKTTVDAAFVGFASKLTLGEVSIRGNPSAGPIVNDSHITIATQGAVQHPDATHPDVNYTPPAPSGGLGYAPTVVTSTGSVAVPSGAGHARITCVGGGGQGGGGGSTSSGATAQKGGGGGGAGGQVINRVALGANTSLTATIGAGGSANGGGGATGGNTGIAGSNGSATSVTGTGISVSASGGSGGQPSAANSTTTANGGIMGSLGGSTAANTNVPSPGVGGANSNGGAPQGASGGGGAAGNAATAGSAGGAGGGAGTAVAGGVVAGGSSASALNGGDGAAAGANTGGGGGAGGGGAGTTGIGGNGGAGGSGVIVIEWLP